jgi:hypothetical protein
MEPIDIVYLWCDGSDKRFRTDKEKYMAQETRSLDVEATGEMRFFDNEELKYSLRSLEKNASWINHVYIITDRQCPKWLNCEYEKVTVIDHSQILPQENIPTFASLAIEYRIHLIPGLSEKFLYGNDDMFFGQSVTPGFFFCGDKTIVRVSPYLPIKRIKSPLQFKMEFARESMWMKTNLNTWKVLNNEYGQQEFYVLHHNVDGYTKSEFKDILKKYAEELEITLHSRFRNKDTLARSLIGLDAVYRGTGILQIVKKMNLRQKHLFWEKTDYCDSYTGSEDSKTIQQIKRFRPSLFCINATNKNDLDFKVKMRTFMEELFPKTSKFEKTKQVF